MIQERDKLRDIKGKSTCHDISNLLYMDEVSESNSSASCWSIF